MANTPKGNPRANDRLIRGLAALMVLIFAGILVYRLSPWAVAELQPRVETDIVQTSATETPDMEQDMENVAHAVLMLKTGPVELELWPDVAPQHVERIMTLADEGFYDNIVFHRVIDGFMAQTGDPTGTGRGGSDLPDLPAEFSDMSFDRGILGMARSKDLNSANSQFFIMLAPAPDLNGAYTAFGRVVSGMEHVDAIKKGSSTNNGLVDGPDNIISFKPDLQ